MRRAIVLAIVLFASVAVAYGWSWPVPGNKWKSIEPLDLGDIESRPCPWRIKSVPESEAEKWMNEGWEPFGVTEKLIWSPTSSQLLYSPEMSVRLTFIYIRKRVCE